MATQTALCSQLSEKNLIRAGKSGNQQALDLLFHRHQGTLFHSALRIMGNQQDAEDALQDGLLSAFHNLQYFEGRSQFSTWLTRVVTNAALMRRRRQAVRPSAAAAETTGTEELPIVERLMSKDPDPEQLLARLETRRIIRDQIAQLTPILRAAFILRKVREYSTSESARLLRVSEQTLKGRLIRARRQLAKGMSRTLLEGVSVNPLPDHEFDREKKAGD
jgi:RNA polymerase sigma-70 factor (ECF subfamily)